jgi:hypothetical protein
MQLTFGKIMLTKEGWVKYVEDNENLQPDIDYVT